MLAIDITADREAPDLGPHCCPSLPRHLVLYHQGAESSVVLSLSLATIRCTTNSHSPRRRGAARRAPQLTREPTASYAPPRRSSPCHARSGPAARRAGPGPPARAH